MIPLDVSTLLGAKVQFYKMCLYKGRWGHDRKVVGFTTSYATTDVASSNLDQGEVYKIM